MRKLTAAFITFSLIFIMIVSCCDVCCGAEKIPAFPGAEGGGKYSPGARGASSVEVYHVTNLKDSGTGSLRDAVSKSGRIIVFDVGGTINLSRTLSISKDNLTILGQTAPGDGITLAGADMSFEGRKNLIIRYLRVRPTDRNGGEPDGLGGRWTNNVIIDHCSTSWSVDETLTLYGGSSESRTPGAHNTVQYTISSESLRMSSHIKGAHGYGGIFGADMSTWHHNLLAHHDSRSPRLDRELKSTDIRNNVIYDWGQTNSAYGAEPYSYNNVTQVPSRVNMVNNYYKYGPGTSANLRSRIFEVSNDYPRVSKSVFYIDGNYVFGNESVTNDNWKGVYNSYLAERSDDPINMSDSSGDYTLAETETAAEAYEAVLADVGATLPRRDAIDARIIADVRNQTGRIINQEEEVSGLTAISDSAPRVFAIPDEWKTENKMGSAKDTDIVKSGVWAGYTWIEAYVNDWTEQQSAPTNPSVTVLSPSVQALSDTVNGQSIDNGAWEVIDQDERLNYKAVAEATEGTEITKIEIYDSTRIIDETEGGEIDSQLSLSPGTHYLSSRAYNDKGEATQSPTSIVYVKASGGAGEYTHTQIGKNKDFDNKGGSWKSGDKYTVMGSGSLTKDYNGTTGVNSDSCDFMYREVTGDFDITVKPEQIPKFENGAVAGIMMRESLEPTARMVMLADGWLKYGENVKAIARKSIGSVSLVSWFNNISNSSSYDTSKSAYTMPKYLRMRRTGDTIALSVSNSGTNWSDNPRKPMTIEIEGLSDTVYVGLAVDSIKNVPQKEYMSEAVFSNLKLSTDEEEPAPSQRPQSYNIAAADTLNGKLEITGTLPQTVSWKAEEHLNEIGGRGTYFINGSDDRDGTVTSYADDTAVFTEPIGGSICARSNVNPNAEPPFSADNEPSGAVFGISVPRGGHITAEVYIYTDKAFNLYDNSNCEFIKKEEKFGAENVYTVEFDSAADGEYYMWASGSKIGLKSITVDTGVKAAAAVGDKVTVITVPDSGYKTSGIASSPECEFTKVSENKYTFIMPAADVTVSAEFVSGIVPGGIYYSERPALRGNTLSFAAVNDSEIKALLAAAVYSYDMALKSIRLYEIEPHQMLDTSVALGAENGDRIKIFLWDKNYSPADSAVEFN